MPETTNLAAGALALLAGTGMATAVAAATLQSIDTGWYNEEAFHVPENTNFGTGRLTVPGVVNLEFRSFFAFDISSLTGPVTSATFELPASTNTVCGDVGFVSTGCYSSPDASETVEFHDVTTAFSELLDGTGGTAAFDDLGSGTLYSSVTVSVDQGDPMPLVSVTLGTEALADLNAAIAGGESDFAIGAAVTTLPASGRQTIWAQSEDDDGTLAQLVLHGPPQIPLPASLPLLAAAVGASGVVLRRRSA